MYAMGVKENIFSECFSTFESGGITKHLMTGFSGNSKFCFQSTSMFPSASPRGTLKVSGKQNSLFPLWPVIKCLLLHGTLYRNYLTLFHPGTTWVQEIVWQIFNKGQVKSTHVRKRMPVLERANHPCAGAQQPDINTLSSPRILKSHLTSSIIPKDTNEDSKCKYIYVARNPKDVAVSYFKFLTNLEILKGPWGFFVKLFLKGNGKFNLFDSALRL